MRRNRHLFESPSAPPWFSFLFSDSLVDTDYNLRLSVTVQNILIVLKIRSRGGGVPITKACHSLHFGQRGGRGGSLDVEAAGPTLGFFYRLFGGV